MPCVTVRHALNTDTIKSHFRPNFKTINRTHFYIHYSFSTSAALHVNTRKATDIRAHSIGITHRGRTGHWNSIDHAICRLLSINPRHYEYRRLIELLMLLGSNKLNIDKQSHGDLVWPVIYSLGYKHSYIGDFKRFCCKMW